MSEISEFFFSAHPAVVQLQMIEISHPNFSTDFRFVRNAVKGVTVLHEGELLPVRYTYMPMQIKTLGTTSSLDQSMQITFGDVGQVLPVQLQLVAAGNGFQIKPTLTYREYRSDNTTLYPSGPPDWTFDGSNDLINIGDIGSMEPDASDAFSLSAWITTTSTSCSIFSKMTAPPVSRGWAFFVQGGQLYGGLVSDATGADIAVQAVTSGSVINDGNLHHVVMTYDGSATLAGFALYVDGVSRSFAVSTDTLSVSDNVAAAGIDVKIGARNPGEFFDGTITNISYWLDDLSPSEVTELYNSGVPSDLNATSMAADLRSWWKLNSLDTPNTDGVIDYGPGPSLINGTAQGGIGLASGELASVLQDPMFGPFELEINGLAFNKSGCTFTAKPPAMNKARTGEIYDIGRFPMLQGFL